MEELPAKQHLAGFWRFTCQVKGRLTQWVTVIPRKRESTPAKNAGSHIGLPWVPACAGTTLRLTGWCLQWRQLPDLGLWIAAAAGAELWMTVVCD
jgi:hypothetical protein